MNMTKDQESILLTLIQSGEAHAWGNDEAIKGWKTKKINTVPVCQWYGITCDNIDGSITTLELPIGSFRGTLPSELGLLTNLGMLDLFSVSAARSNS